MLNINVSKLIVRDDLAAYLHEEFKLPVIAALDMADGIVTHLGEKFARDLAEIEQVKQNLRDIVVEIATD